MMKIEKEPLFRPNYLQEARFPKLDAKGAIACDKEIKRVGIEQFLEDGWWTLYASDKILRKMIENCVLPGIQEKSLNSDFDIFVKSVKYGASLVYYPLQILVEQSDGEYVMPEISDDQTGNLRCDFKELNWPNLINFLSVFDEDLAKIIDSVIQEKELLEELGINKMYTFYSAIFTYFALASKAECEGIQKCLNIHDL